MLIKGQAFWCRVVGAPHDNKFTKSKQWSFDLSVDKETIQKLLEAGMRKTYIRNKADERGDFLSFQRDATKKDGTEGKPFKIVDAQNNPWPTDKLIGNGSTLNVIVTLNEREFRGEKFLKPSAINLQVWDLVEYSKGSSGSGFPVKEVSSEGDTSTSDKEW